MKTCYVCKEKIHPPDEAVKTTFVVAGTARGKSAHVACHAVTFSSRKPPEIMDPEEEVIGEAPVESQSALVV